MSQPTINWKKMKAQLEGKVAVLFGASVGIGAATGRILADSGAKVVLASRNTKALESLVEDIRASGGHAVAVRTDVQNFNEVKAAVDVAVENFGGLDIAVNNAGINVAPAPVDEVEEDVFDRVMTTNLKGIWYGMKAAIPEIRKRGGGAIVNTSSVGGLVAAPGLSPYCARDRKVIGLSRAAALDCAPMGIRVNVVAPGAVDTDIFNNWMDAHPEQRSHMISLHPLGRIGEPPEVGSAIAWLCSDAASFITGAVLAIDGGYMIA